MEVYRLQREAEMSTSAQELLEHSGGVNTTLQCIEQCLHSHGKITANLQLQILKFLELETYQT
jgi:hypothetical protein